MNVMSRDYVEAGRSRQKQRTRDQLVAAAWKLMESGDTPRVEDAAEAAGISRTTAYRYFASQAELLAAAFPETARESMLPDPAPMEPADRVAAVAAGVVDRIAETEHLQRTMLRLSLGDAPHDLPLRQGRVIPWFVEALEPLAEAARRPRRPSAGGRAAQRLRDRDPGVAERHREARRGGDPRPPAVDD